MTVTSLSDNNPNSLTKMMQDLMGSFPMDTKALQDAFKTQATLGDKMSKVAFEAVEKSTDISSKFTKETLAKLAAVAIVKEEPTEHTKAVTDFASAQAELDAETIAAFAEVTKKVQMETVELLLAAGKDIQEDAIAAVKKAAAEVISEQTLATGTDIIGYAPAALKVGTSRVVQHAEEATQSEDSLIENIHIYAAMRSLDRQTLQLRDTATRLTDLANKVINHV